MPISLAKGLEVDGVVVVEPARIVASEIQGLRALYVALTRPTQRLTIVHAEPLPEPLAGVRRRRRTHLADFARSAIRAIVDRR